MLSNRQRELPQSDQEMTANAAREFELSDADFRNFTRLAQFHAGIALTNSKRNLIYSRLSRRLRALDLRSFRDYLEFLQSPDGEAEIQSFINAISTNLTKLFRESHHFDHLRTHVAARFAQDEKRKPGRRLRIWSAGCSTGEEPYTIAAVLCREVPDMTRYDIRILATDIDTEVLRKAAHGEYQADILDDVPSPYRSLIAPEISRADATFVMPDELQSVIRFRHLNLMGSWPFGGKFDAIFCRNVMIYFDGPTKAQLIDRFVDQLKPDGWLYIGHSESLLGSHPRLELVGRTVYRRLP